MGLEILEDLPDVQAVICGIGGGGLIAGVGSAIKALKPGVKIYGSEPETGCPRGALAQDGIGAGLQGLEGVVRRWRRRESSMFPRMWERIQPLVDDYVVVTLDETKQRDAS